MARQGAQIPAVKSTVVFDNGVEKGVFTSINFQTSNGSPATQGGQGTSPLINVNVDAGSSGALPASPVGSFQFNADGASFGGAGECTISDDLLNLLLGDPADVYPDAGFLRLAYPGAVTHDVITMLDDAAVTRIILGVGVFDSVQFGDTSQIFNLNSYWATWQQFGATNFIYCGAGGTSLQRVSDSLEFLTCVFATGNIETASPEQVTIGDAHGALRNASPAAIVTTDATPTVADSYTLATGAQAVVTWEVSALKADASQGAAYVVTATYRNQSGTLHLVGAITASYTAEDDASWDATITTSGTDIEFQVTGRAATTITWKPTRTILLSIP